MTFVWKYTVCRVEYRYNTVYLFILIDFCFATYYVLVLEECVIAGDKPKVVLIDLLNTCTMYRSYVHYSQSFVYIVNWYRVRVQINFLCFLKIVFYFPNIPICLLSLTTSMYNIEWQMCFRAVSRWSCTLKNIVI